MKGIAWLMALATASILGLSTIPTSAVPMVDGWIFTGLQLQLLQVMDNGARLLQRCLHGNQSKEEQPTKFTIELYIICDYYCSGNQGTPDKTRDFIVNSVNVASRSMKQLNTELVIVGLDLWSEYGWTNWTTPKQDMAPQYGWLGSRINYYLKRSYFDEIILLSGIQLGYAGVQGDIEGFNTKGCLSNSGCSGIISLSLRSSTQSLGVVIAHELGHALNMDHDGSGCSCSNGPNGCIMAPSMNDAKIARPTFSSCSQSVFAAWINSSNGIALRKPLAPADAMIGRSRCGNGIIEDGEQCDCGPACLPDGCCSCCNNCQLVNGAQCASGKCCNTPTCKFLAAGTLCRRSRDEFCDSNDFCSGNSIECKNTYLADWTDCTDFANEAAYCKGGFCNSINVQCRFVWSRGFRAASDNCFKNAFDASQNTASYYKCQTLICNGNGSTSGIPSGRNRRRITTSKNEECSTGNYLQMETGLLGLSGTMMVEDGTKCGPSSACFAGQCIATADAKRQIQSKPVFKRKTQYCGNGRVEAGEDCDCGPKQCSCCDLNTCKYKAANTPCLGSCALCSGKSADCPSPTAGSVISDFKQCKGVNDNMCYRGSCVGLDSTCRAHFLFAASADFVYPQNVGKASSTFNSGGFFAVDDSNDLTIYEEYRSGEDTGICGIVQCNTLDVKGFYNPPGSSQSYPIKNIALSTANIRVMYYQPRASSQTATVPGKGSKTVKIFYPLIADEGTPCKLATNKDGYCRTLEAQSTGIPSITYYYSKCTEIPSTPPNGRYQFYPFD